MYELNDLKNRTITKTVVANRIVYIINKIEQEGVKNSDYVEELSLYYFHYYDVYQKFEKRITFILDSVSDDIKNNFASFGLVDLEEGSLSFDLGSKYKLVMRFLTKKMQENRIMTYQKDKKFDSKFLLSNLVNITKFDLLIMVPNKASVGKYEKNIEEIFGSRSDVQVITSSVSTREEGKKNIYVLTPDKILNVCKNGCSIQIDYMIWEQNQLMESNEITGFIFDMILKSVNRCYPNIYYIITNDLFDLNVSLDATVQSTDFVQRGLAEPKIQQKMTNKAEKKISSLKGQFGSYSFAMDYTQKY